MVSAAAGGRRARWGVAGVAWPCAWRRHPGGVRGLAKARVRAPLRWTRPSAVRRGACAVRRPSTDIEGSDISSLFSSDDASVGRVACWLFSFDPN